MKTPHGSKNNDDARPEHAWAVSLRAGYDEVAQEPMPDRFRELLEQLDDAESRGR